MKDLTPKQDNTAGVSGQLTADEFNDFADDVQNSITESGQSLTGGVGDDNRQLMKAISSGSSRITRSNGESAEIGERVTPDNATETVSIALPTTGLFVGATIYFEPAFDQLYSSFALTLDGGANSIMGDAADFVMDSTLSDNKLIAAVWVGGSVGWKIIPLSTIGVTL